MIGNNVPVFGVVRDGRSTPRISNGVVSMKGTGRCYDHVFTGHVTLEYLHGYESGITVPDRLPHRGSGQQHLVRMTFETQLMTAAMNISETVRRAENLGVGQ